MSIDGGPELVQLLTPEGVLVDHPDYALSLTDAAWRHRYADLVMVRRLDAEATALQRHGELGLWAPCQGQEAAQVGAARATRTSDRIFPTYREHGMAYVRGVDPVTLLGLFRGTTLGGWDPADHGFSLYTIVIGDQTLHAVGYAMGIQRDATDDATLVCFGDGASSQGDVAESFVYAAVNDAPVVFFCQNNQWAISEPIALQSRIPLFQRAQGFGFPGVQVDGNDVLAVKAVTDWAMARARAGEGPAFIEAFTYRMGAHTTSDDPTKYRERSDEEEWRGRDPIARLSTYLRAEGAVDDEWFAGVDAEAKELGAAARASIPLMENTTMDKLFATVYAEPTVALEAQRREYAEFAASFGEDA